MVANQVLNKALEKAERFVALNNGVDDFAGDVSRDILGPILRAYKATSKENGRLRALLAETLQELDSAADGDTPLMRDMRKALGGTKSRPRKGGAS